MRKTLLALCLTVFIACPLLGDQPDGEYRLYLAFTIGDTFFSSPAPTEGYWILDIPCYFCIPPYHANIDTTYTLGFRLGYNIAPHWDLETSLHYSRTHWRIEGPFFASSEQQIFVYQSWVDKIDVFSYHTNLIYYFVKKRVQPFITAGMGGITFNGEQTPTITNTITNFAINLGGGVKYLLKKRLRISFDIKNLIIFNEYIFEQTRNNLALTLAAEFLF